MRQKNRRRSLLTLYHHKHNDENGNENTSSHHEAHYANHHHLLHSDKSTYFYILKARLLKLVSKFRLGPQSLMHTSIPLLVSGFGLLVVLGAMVCPSISMNGNILSSNDKAYAEGGISTHDTTGMSVSLTMANPDQTTLSNPNSETGKVNYISSGFTVTTANVDGYNVYLQTAPGSTNTLSNGKISIDFVKEDTPTSSFTDNTWGYKVDATGTKPENLTYNPIPASNTTALNPAYSSKSTGETKDFTLNFAAKFASDAPAGHYSTDVILSVAAGTHEVVLIEEPTGFTGGNTTIYNMQDMTPEICTAATEGESGRLRDIRDNKIYWVTKLKDNNCWMTQNLDLDLWNSDTNSGVVLTSDNSDIPYNNDGTAKSWISTTGAGNNFWKEGDISANIARYYNPGMYINSKPTVTADGQGCGLLNSAECEKVGWINVQGMASSNDATFSEAFVNSDNWVYNAHLLIGNYYTFGAATAGEAAKFTDTSTYPAEMTQSICPKGWQIVAGNKTATTLNSSTSTIDAENAPNKSFEKLFASYGNWVASTMIFGSQNVLTAPVYLLTGGTIDGGPSDGFSWASRNGYYWTTMADASDAFGLTGRYLWLSPSYNRMVISNDSRGAQRKYGQNVRCVAR